MYCLQIDSSSVSIHISNIWLPLNSEMKNRKATIQIAKKYDPDRVSIRSCQKISETAPALSTGSERL